jgi:hypothetical protein
MFDNLSNIDLSYIPNNIFWEKSDHAFKASQAEVMQGWKTRLSHVVDKPHFLK